ncbi:Putative peroxidase [Flavobacterium indicum GPTSA100-9 = DSM 17447]|uniref:Putative peroxidase n=1 Tax=Flavobacterium indicum (strain DSM 17447 / CIP 109464 / GPTSA100-9) TaxID=1094466 RepID=H8XTN6_FLAIG|nr:carboxymuconolactone decarboxylase family protein [Flavobacterium indicum]CCG53616.1 Putative peroxidase [Flavobacterium indicum GPTSA100-9 = DSM 17447]
MAHLKLENNTVSSITSSILDATKSKLGFAPNMYVKMGNNPALLDAYTYSYNSFRANSGFNYIEQEVIFLSIAFENNCEYCVAAHSFVADMMSKVPTEVTDAIRNNQQIPDLKLGALSKLTRSLTVNRGMASQTEIDDFIAVGYTEAHVLGIIAGIGVKALSNYSNHLTNPEVDAAFAGRKWEKRI